MIGIKRRIHIIFIIGSIQFLFLCHRCRIARCRSTALYHICNDSRTVCESKIEQTVNSASVICSVYALICPCFADNIGIRIDLFYRVIKPCKCFYIFLVFSGIVGRGCIHPEAVHAKSEPECRNIFEFFLHRRIVQIQIRHS